MIVGFIGFGEAGSTIAGGLAAAGVERILAFDIASTDPLGPASSRSRPKPARRQDWSARLNLRSHFGLEGPKTAAEVVAVVSRLTNAPGSSTGDAHSFGRRR